MKKNNPNLTKQGLKNLNFIKGKSVGRVLEMPPDFNRGCIHPSNAIYIDKDGDAQCKLCKQFIS